METPPVSGSTKKTLAGSLTKTSLTPCRRLGLSRRSSSSLRKSDFHTNGQGYTPNTRVHETVVKNNPVVNTPKLNCGESHTVPLRLSDTQNKHGVIRKVRRCLTNVSKTPSKVEGETSGDLESGSVKGDSQTSKKIKLSLEQIDIDNEVIKRSSSMLNSSSYLVYKPDSSVIPMGTMDDIETLSVEVTPEALEKLVCSIKEKKKKLEQSKVQEIYAKKHNLDELRAQTAKWKKAGREALEYSVSLAKHAGCSVTIKQLMIQHSFPQHLMGYNSEDDDFE